MSHFTVCVRVPDSLVAQTGSVKAAVAMLLAPYQENNMDDCPKEFLSFNDVTEEHEEKYKTDMCSRVRLADGAEFSAFDDRFRNRNSSPLDFKAPRYVYPEGSTELERPVSEIYTFDQYVTEYCGYRKDAESGRYGYWENPNNKWDWWQIGGRWTGLFPLKAGAKGIVGEPGLMTKPAKEDEADGVRVADIDFDLVARKTHEAAQKFWDQWQLFLAGWKFGPFEGPRDKALSIGLLDVKREALTSDEETRSISWAGSVPPDDSRSSWHDVYKVVTREEFLRDYLMAFNPISTYAVLDETGWKEPGRMGWFGCSSDTPESYMQSKNDFMSWVRATPASARLVVVDCHI